MKKINVSLDNNSLEYVSLRYNPIERNPNYKALKFKTYGDNKILKKKDMLSFVSETLLI